MQKNSRIIIFGGSGSLGVSLISRLISIGQTNILSVSRNESSAVALKERFPGIQIMIGDISDAWTVKSAMVGAEQCMVLSALKHVGIAETSVNSCIMTNIIGLMNIVNESLQAKPKVLMFISTDKAAQGNGVYGCSKKIGERLIAEAERINPDTKYRVVRYGNVWGSNGSIITKWRPKLEKGEEVILTDPEASRFFWTMDEAVDLIFECIEKAKNSDPFIPRMKSVQMGVVLEACMDVYGKSPVKVIGLQPGENKVETTDGVTFSDQCEQFTKDEFKEKFLLSGTVIAPQSVSFSKTTEESYIGSEEAKKIWDESKPNPLVCGIPKRENSQIGTTQPKISCVLITKEAQYPEIVLERLNQGFFDEIIIVTECESIYHRYLAAQKAKNDIIYVQDDDCMVNYRALFSYYNSYITNTMTKEFKDKYEDPRYTFIGCTLVGWGCYFPKSMLSVFDKYIAKYGIDNHLLREADRIFTYLNQQFNTVIMSHEDLPQAAADDRMGYQEDHYTSMQEALKKCADL
jgi:UDP-N-acetylglucosamine 4,6-dehydratase/UDP-glucose 4-epimerase